MNGLLTGSSRIQKISLNGTEVVDDVLAVEEPLEILLRFGANGAPTEKNSSTARESFME